MKKRIVYLGALASLMISSVAYTQEKIESDSVKIKENDRNVMLNASNNTGPRDVNMGLPASVGGTTVLENGLPVVYFFWPELPTKAWRMDAMMNKTRLYDLGHTAIEIGDVGFSVGTYNNLGSDKFRGNGSLNTNHFGLLRGDLNISGPIANTGIQYSASAYLSFDPGTFKAEGLPKYYADKTQLYKGALTKEYNIDGMEGTITLFYKYANSQGIRQSYAPFIYVKSGKIKELNDFKMGRNSYYENSGKITLQDAYTGEYVERDIIKDYGSESHTVDLIWKNKFQNGFDMKFIGRYHSAKTGNYLPLMTGVWENNNSNTRYTYQDGRSYTGDNVQSVLVLASKKTPIETFSSTFEVGRKSDKHNWNFGLNLWTFSINKYTSEGATYYQEVAPNPSKLIKETFNPQTQTWDRAANKYGNNFAGIEYHNGSEVKGAVFITDHWEVSNVVELNLGARLENQTLNGDYQDSQAIDPSTGKTYTNLNGPKTSINKTWWNKSFMANAVFKTTRHFGFLAEVLYNEQGGHLENYSIGVDPKIKKSKIPEAGAGIYYNLTQTGSTFLPELSLISKATYIQRDEYRATVNFSNPTTGEVKREATKYNIETIGWTTDVVATLVKGFDLHFLLTIQSPKYKKFTGTVDWGGNTPSTAYDFSDKTVTGVSNMLIEIDPSYTWKNLRVWASARYFSKQYINKPNTLELESRWETFAGANYKINNHLSVSATFVNLLNQRGASGSMPDGDLILTDEQAKEQEGRVMSGTYIRPFTAEFGLRYNF